MAATRSRLVRPSPSYSCHRPTMYHRRSPASGPASGEVAIANSACVASGPWRVASGTRVDDRIADTSKGMQIIPGTASGFQRRRPSSPLGRGRRPASASRSPSPRLVPLGNEIAGESLTQGISPLIGRTPWHQGPARSRRGRLHTRATAGTPGRHQPQSTRESGPRASILARDGPGPTSCAAARFSHRRHGRSHGPRRSPASGSVIDVNGEPRPPPRASPVRTGPKPAPAGFKRRPKSCHRWRAVEPGGHVHTEPAWEGPGDPPRDPAGERPRRRPLGPLADRPLGEVRHPEGGRRVFPSRPTSPPSGRAREAPPCHPGEWPWITVGESHRRQASRSRGRGPRRSGNPRRGYPTAPPPGRAGPIPRPRPPSPFSASGIARG